MSEPAPIPAPPDPVKTAAAQEKQNVGTATAQYGLNATNQTTPYGNLTYSQIGTWPDGTPHFQATQSLSPQEQQLFDQYTQNQQKIGTIGGNQITKVGNLLSTPWSLDNATADKISGMQHEFLDPQWDKAQEADYNRLANMGIPMGSEAYNTATRNFADQRARAYDQMYLDAYKTGEQSSLTQRNQPINEITALQSGSQVQQPNFIGTPQSQLSTPDLAGMTYQSYAQGPMAQWNATNRYNQAFMGGLFGLGSAALGGGARLAGGGAFGTA